MLARGEKEINQLLLKFVCCRFAFGFSGPPLFHRETFAKNSFYTTKFSSPQQKTGKEVFFSMDLFCFLSFPFQIMNANGWHRDIRIFVCPLDSFSAFYKWHDVFARTSSTDRRRYAQQPLHRAAFMRTCSYTERFVQRETFAHFSPSFGSSSWSPTFLLPLPKSSLSSCFFEWW